MRHRIATLASRYGVKLVDPSATLCDGVNCLIAYDGYNIYRDDDYLLVKDLLLLKPLFEPILASMRH